MIIAWSVPYIDKNNHEVIDVTTTDGSTISKTVFKRARKQKYINTDSLSATDKIFVDIALKAQVLMGTPSHLVSLKDLFIEGDWVDIPHSELHYVLTTNYYEDTNGNQIPYNKYCEEWLGLPQMIKTYNGLHIPTNLSQDTVKSGNIVELTDFKKDNFQLSDEQINLLNNFLNGFIELQNSSLCIQHKALSLRIVGNQFYLQENISEEQFKASIVSFRKLYMQNEPANFNKAVKILQNKKIVPEAMVKAINYANDQYKNLLNRKINNYIISFQLKTPGKDTLKDKKCVDLITAMFNVDCIHQGNNETLALAQEIEQIIPVFAVRKFLLWQLLLELLHPISLVAKQTYRILDILGKVAISEPKKNISNVEHSFQIYIINKVYELAEIIWNENGRDTPSIMFYRDTALSKIAKRFALNKNLFNDLIPPFDYNKAIK